MNLKLLQIFFYGIVNVESKADYFRVEETSGEELSGCYQRIKLQEYPIYQKIDEPKYFLMHDGKCWVFSSDENGSDIRFRLR